ncbi:MAG: hypothetical protein ACRD21_22140, partial [Vicinamibacteria bacterium]
MLERAVRASVRSLSGDLLELASDLVKHSSVTGSEDQAQRALAERLSDWGLECDLWRIDPSIRSHPAFCDDENPVERLNLVARWGEGAKDEASLLLNGHIDVVPE